MENEIKNTAAPVDENDPAFQFLGVPRQKWGPLFNEAFVAERNAANAEAAAEAAEARFRERKEEIARVEAELANAAEDAAIAKAVANAAREDIDRATSREERATRKEKAAETETEAETASSRAREIRQHGETLRNSLPIVYAEAERTRGNARRIRTAADAAAKRALEQELPTIRANIARAEAAKRAEREAAALMEARAHLTRTACRDCRHWMPFDADPSKGTCHARPGEPPTVSAANFCAMGEAVPPPSKK